MNAHPHELAILEEHRRVRYLKVIALFKILKGALLLGLGFSLLFLNSRPVWLDQISDWTDDQLLLHHSKAITSLLNKLQAALSGGALRATGILSLFYCGVLFTEGIGVYMQKRWAEFLMIFATGALIPIDASSAVYRAARFASSELFHCLVSLHGAATRQKCVRSEERTRIGRNALRSEPDWHYSAGRGKMLNSASAEIVFSIGNPTTLV
jgi:uncharacterized membrane protein (DUF2068 family)